MAAVVEVVVEVVVVEVRVSVSVPAMQEGGTLSRAGGQADWQTGRRARKLSPAISAEAVLRGEGIRCGRRCGARERRARRPGRRGGWVQRVLSRDLTLTSVALVGQAHHSRGPPDSSLTPTALAYYTPWRHATATVHPQHCASSSSASSPASPPPSCSSRNANLVAAASPVTASQRLQMTCILGRPPTTTTTAITTTAITTTSTSPPPWPKTSGKGNPSPSARARRT